MPLLRVKLIRANYISNRGLGSITQSMDYKQPAVKTKVSIKYYKCRSVWIY